MNVSALIEPINTLLDCLRPGATLPPATDESTLIVALEAVAAVFGIDVNDEQKPEEIGPEKPSMWPVAQLSAPRGSARDNFPYLVELLNALMKKAMMKPIDKKTTPDQLASVLTQSVMDWLRMKAAGGMPANPAEIAQMGGRLGTVSKRRKLVDDYRSYAAAGMRPEKALAMAKREG